MTLGKKLKKGSPLTEYPSLQKKNRWGKGEERKLKGTSQMLVKLHSWTRYIYLLLPRFSASRAIHVHLILDGV